MEVNYSIIPVLCPVRKHVMECAVFVHVFMCVVHKMGVTVNCYMRSLCINCTAIVGTVGREKRYWSSGMSRLGSHTV